jgi:uncharacterized protein YjbJ (UPF0337 family)
LPQPEEGTVNWDQIEGNWKQLRGKVRQQWGKLTDDELDQIEGKREELVGQIQESYGIAREEAERQVVDWERRQLKRPARKLAPAPIAAPEPFSGAAAPMES